MSDLKLEISKSLLKASKEGCAEECNPDRPEKEILLYCKKNFDNMFKLGECVKHESFCFVCCENEFGELHLDKRDNCYSKCNDYYINKKKFKSTKTLVLNVDINPTSTRKRIETKDIPLKKNELENKKIGINKLDNKEDVRKKYRQSLKKELLKLIKKDLSEINN